MLYAGTYKGLFKSANDGKTWIAMNRGLKGDVVAIAIDPTNPRTLFVSCFLDGVFISKNAGRSWVEINDGLVNLDVRTLVIDPQGTTLYAGTFGSGLMARPL